MSTTVLSKVNLGPHHNHVGGNVENTQLCRRYPCMYYLHVYSKELFFIIIIDKRIVYGHHKYQNHQNYTKPTKTSKELIVIPRFGIYGKYLPNLMLVFVHFTTFLLKLVLFYKFSCR